MVHFFFKTDVFKQEFKRFRRPSDDDMKNAVIDFANPNAFYQDEVSSSLGGQLTQPKYKY